MSTAMLLPMMLAAAAGALQPTDVELSPSQLFGLAGQLEAGGQLAEAENAYRALAADPDIELRTEARFRLSRLLVRQGKLRPAALLLRQILDEKPDAQPVRLELAAILARLGDLPAARRELRAASAGELPPEVRLLVERSAIALRSVRPFGGTISVGLAQDSNINRATRSDTLGTVIGDFTLSDDARETSGTGLRTEGQAFVRLPVGRHHLSASVGGSASLYRRSEFNDVALSARLGPELAVGPVRLNLAATAGRRWFGGERLNDQAGLALDLLRPVGPRSQVRFSLSATRLLRHRNPLEEGWTNGATIALDHALSPRLAVGVSLAGSRNEARDAGYASTSGSIAAFAVRESGPVTLSLSASMSELLADERLFLYPEQRHDRTLRGQLGATLRPLSVGGFAPQLRLVAERNRSSIEIYDYRRTAVEFGVVRAF